jgi:hypothetical protein
MSKIWKILSLLTMILLILSIGSNILLWLYAAYQVKSLQSALLQQIFKNQELEATLNQLGAIVWNIVVFLRGGN